MAQQNLLTDSHIAAFKGIDLHKYLSLITDTREPRLVAHEFPKRDGAKQEWMGRGPFISEWRITYTGPTWKSDLLALVASLDETPIGLLTHPVYGGIQCACRGNKSVINIPEALDTIEITLTFVENVLDQSTNLDGVLGVSEARQNVTSTLSDLLTSAANLAAAAVTTAVSSLNTTATAYAAAAGDSAQSNTADPSLDAKLAAVGNSTGNALDAVIAVGPTDATHFDTLALIELVYTACLDLNDAAFAARPVVAEYIVPGDTSVARLAAQLYPTDAANRINEILSLNRIPNPALIRSGTKLVLSTT